MNTPAKLLLSAATFGVILTLAAAQQPTVTKANLLTNPSFEDGLNGWSFAAHEKRGTIAVDTVEKHDGKNSIRIDNPAGDDSFLQQTVTVKPKTRYRLTGYLKTKDVVVKGTGANISLAGGFERTEAFDGKQNWKKVSFEFDSGALDTIKIGPRLGHYSNMAMGTAWFDDLQLIEVGPSRKR
jgi:hypothetical protein